MEHDKFAKSHGILFSVMEKSWNMTNLPKVMEFYFQSWNFTNFAPKMYQICRH